MSERTVRRLVLVLAMVVLEIFLISAIHSVRWIGQTFPGFLVMGNRVVASISLPEWEIDSPDLLFQHEIVAVDGQEVQSAEDVYAIVWKRPVGSTVRYQTLGPDVGSRTYEARSRTFSLWDFTFLHGAFLLNGLFFVGTSLLVLLMQPKSPVSFGLLASCFTTGVFVTTASDLYGPHWFFRVHVLAETFMGAGFIHLALVFPVDRLADRRQRTLSILYAPFVLLAVCYQWVLYQPSAYTLAHLIASATHGIGAVWIIGALIYGRLTSSSMLVRSRVTVVALGALIGLFLPGVLMAGSAIYSGGVALNAAAFTAVLFPLSLGYAVVKQDLFDLDVAIRLAVTYMLVVLVISTTYLGLFAILGTSTTTRDLLLRAPILLGIFNLMVLFALAPIKSRVQAAVDRVFFRQHYDAPQALAELGKTLARAHTFVGISRETRRVLDASLSPQSVRFFTYDEDRLFDLDESDRTRATVLPSAFGSALENVPLLSRYAYEESVGAATLPWDAGEADVLVPIRSGQSMIGVMVLGVLRSGRAYTSSDRSFLIGTANQVALAWMSATAFSQLTDLNAGLEQKVRDRTAELARTNDELTYSLDELRRNQESLVRSDRLATLGRLAAGIAHEVNTPLGAVLSELKILSELGREYEESIADPGVTAKDHQDIAGEILETARAATSAARKAAAFVSRVKTHGRDSRTADAGRFTVTSVVEEARALLAHRLRAATCDLSYSEEPESVGISGEPGHFSQVVTNLVANAIDAYEDSARSDGRIEIHAREEGGAVIVTVRDWAGGMPPEVAARVFEELFTTKEAGRGTGLGLWISRNMIAESFAGTLTVESQVDEGTCFTITVPSGAAVADASMPPPLPGAASPSGER